MLFKVMHKSTARTVSCIENGSSINSHFKLERSESSPMRSRFVGLLGAGFLGLAFPALTAEAGTILVFGQNGIGTDFNATNNGSNGASGGTKLSAVDIAITVTGIDNSSPLPSSFPSAFLNLTATSVSNATIDGSGHITQDFSGSFSITELAGGGGELLIRGIRGHGIR